MTHQPHKVTLSDVRDALQDLLAPALVRKVLERLQPDEGPVRVTAEIEALAAADVRRKAG